jgi:hypothetical protein
VGFFSARALGLVAMISSVWSVETLGLGRLAAMARVRIITIIGKTLISAAPWAIIGKSCELLRR